MNQYDSTEEWISFEGTAEEGGNSYVLRAPEGFGALEISSDDVQITGTDIKVRKGAGVTVVEEPDHSRQPQYLNLLNECNCPVRILATGRNETIQKPGCESKCFGVILVCYYCDYGPSGVQSGDHSSICGGCIGFPF